MSVAAQVVQYSGAGPHFNKDPNLDDDSKGSLASGVLSLKFKETRPGRRRLGQLTAAEIPMANLTKPFIIVSHRSSAERSLCSLQLPIPCVWRHLVCRLSAQS